MTLEWLASATTGLAVPYVLYKVSANVPFGHQTVSAVLWAGTSGGPVIAFWSGHRGPPPRLPGRKVRTPEQPDPRGGNL